MNAEDKIIRIIEHIRPYILADGGDLQFVSYKDHIVTVSLTGACASCGMIDTTLNEGIRQWIMDEVDEVEDVVLDIQTLQFEDLYGEYFY